MPRSTERRRLLIQVQGAVQGVGFRPFVYRLATQLDLDGWVVNDARGVLIEVEGTGAALRHFLDRLPTEAPPRALLQDLSSTWLAPVGHQGFAIRASEQEGAKTVLVLPDLAACPACIAEARDPADRRHRYPFTNCTDCGPRFSIVRELPYDRPNTTMSGFTMCAECQREYENPIDRRFHAQPNACPACGPQLAFRTARASGGSAPDARGDAALRAAAQALWDGGIVAVKGLGGFHLMLDARNEQAVERLRSRKPRRDKPLAIMAPSLEQVRLMCEAPAAAEAVLASPESPIVLLRRLPPDRARIEIAAGVAPDVPHLGVMLPYTPLHDLLLREVGFPVVATSGNLADEPICIDETEAMERLGQIADAFLVHDRPIARHVDDSIVWHVRGETRLLRRARGYAPLPVLLKRAAPTILAVGAHLKNTVALSIGRHAFISQHIGDLEAPEAMAAFERVIADFCRLYEATPLAIAHDMHPDYLSTTWALRAALRPGPALIAVQHHHAHLASCLAEHGIDGAALGVAWDGAGYGADGVIWGGEFLVGDAAGYRRVAHLRPFRLLGGDAAVHEPGRAAYALLWQLYGESVHDMDALVPVRAFDAVERRLFGRMLAQPINAPLCTSAGRLFDGIAALIGLQQKVSFEGQAAMRLEQAVDPDEHGAYPIALETAGDARPVSEHARSRPEEGRSSRTGDAHPASALVLDWRPMVEAVLADLRRGASPGTMAARFHNGLVDAIVSIAQIAGEGRVALTGGCFQNRVLVERAADRLEQAGFQVLLHRQVPPNDGGISLGQVAVSAAALENAHDASSRASIRLQEYTGAATS